MVRPTFFARWHFNELLFRMLRDVLLDVWRKRKTNKLFTLFVLLLESGTLYAVILVRVYKSHHKTGPSIPYRLLTFS